MRSLVIEDEPQIAAYLGRLPGQLCGIVDIVRAANYWKKPSMRQIQRFGRCHRTAHELTRHAGSIGPRL